MLRLPTFRYRAAASAREAAAILSGEGAAARIVAGGTDLYPNMKRRHQHAATLVSLRKAPGLSGIKGDPDHGMTIGAMTTLSAITEHPLIREAYPGLARAVASISTPVLRNMGTIGGNLCLDTRCTYYNQSPEWRESISYCMKEAGDVCWVAPGSPRCWATSASDSAPLLAAIGARVKLVGPDGERVVPLPEIYRDDGIDYLAKRADEVMTEIHLPPARVSRSTYWKLRRRGAIDFPVLGVGAAITQDAGGIVTSAAIFLGAVASYPIPAREAAAQLVGKKLSPATIAAAATLARNQSTPLDNTDFTLAWRKSMVERYVAGALSELGGLPFSTPTPRHGRSAG